MQRTPTSAAPRDDDSAVKRYLPLSLLASLLIFAGLIALLAPELIEALLPAEIAELLRANALLVLLIGLGLEGYFVYQIVRTALARTRRTMASVVADAGAATPVGIPDDAIARRTAWTPASGGGANFRTRRLVARGPGRYEIRSTLQMQLFGGLFLAVGVTVGAGFWFAGRRNPLSADVLVPLAFGLLFASIGAALLYFFSRPAVFDRQSGWYWRGAPTLRAPAALRKLKHATELGNIHALQLIAEHVSGSDSSYTSYELNLVLKDGRRLNVMDHGDRTSIEADAATLARFLGVPVWNKL